MTMTTPKPATEKLAQDLAKGSLDPKHGLGVPQKIQAATKTSKS
jgi:hypothetical protein